MDTWRDLRYGLRSLIKTPLFTVVALVTIALGTGANTAIYSVINAALLRPLPYDDPDRLVMVWGTSETKDRAPVAVPDFFDWLDQNESFLELAAFHPWTFNVTGEGPAERIGGGVTTSNLFELMGIKPALGRTFSEDGPGAVPTIVLGYGLWQRRFGGAPDVLGKSMNLDDQAHEIIGVMPAGFDFPSEAQLWQPIPYGPSSVPRNFQFLRVLGRLKPGSSLEKAQSDMGAIASRLEETFPDSNQGRGVNLIPLHEQLVGDTRSLLLFLQLAVALVLAIACVNVANLLLSRASVRQDEIAVRAALGASKLRLLRQRLIESLSLALAGSAIGLFVAFLGMRFLVSYGPQKIPRLNEATIDGGVLAFTLAIAMAAGLLFGMVPAVFSGANLFQTLKSSDRTRIRSPLARNFLVFLEVAIALMLLIGAGLLMQSFLRLRSESPGFRTDNLLTMRITLPQKKYPEKSHTNAFFNELRDRVESLPGVESMAAGFSIPMAGGMKFDGNFEIEGKPRLSTDPERVAYLRPVTPDYFRTMGIPILAGRSFNEQDGSGPGVVVINQRLARRFWPGKDSMGAMLTVGADLDSLGSMDEVPREIVGIAGDVKHSGLDKDAVLEIYFSTLQSAWRQMNLAIRTIDDPTALAKPIVAEIAAVDPDLPVSNVRSMEQVIGRSVSQPRFNMWLLSIFAAIALSLAVGGIYGIVSYSVQQRAREIGLRMALGAKKQDVMRMVVRQGMLPVLFGTVAGIGAAFFLTRLLEGLLFGVSATDPATYLAVCGVLAAAALMASYIPARQATRRDPMAILRYE